ncbi:hypothetical protein PHYBOEH_005557 [Phytophthora boehmeriae]|uniref:PexRD2 WYL domain-containing protein n=1 Tax=Phytophthora boehmeriae TaxID=109152 RepID=A0A8T1WQI0_9STRA|nr:hypothetical protein PHYBOEH_005557 [Phytophthora boehmeriae]
MRLSHVLVVIAATLLLTSEAISAANSNPATASEVASPGGTSQRLLRIHHMVYEDDEERALTPAKMKRMKKAGMTKEDYASELGISDEIARLLSGGTGLLKFLESDKYDKYKTYMNYLIEARKKNK